MIFWYSILYNLYCVYIYIIYIYMWNYVHITEKYCLNKHPFRSAGPTGHLPNGLHPTPIASKVRWRPSPAFAGNLMLGGILWAIPMGGQHKWVMVKYPYHIFDSLKFVVNCCDKPSKGCFFDMSRLLLAMGLWISRNPGRPQQCPFRAP